MSLEQRYCECTLPQLNQWWKWPYFNILPNGNPVLDSVSQWQRWKPLEKCINAVPLIYPIILVDTTVPPTSACGPVENVEVPVVGISDATVTWDAFPNYTRAQVQYGSISLPTSQWSILETTDALMRLEGLNTDFPRLGVRVRGICDEAREGGVMTEWSDIVYFNLLPDTNASIEKPQGSQLHIVLQPNPSSGEVVITSLPLLQSIDIWNDRGILVYSEAATGPRVELNLSDLPAGAYLVTIHTAGGITTKKLLLQ